MATQLQPRLTGNHERDTPEHDDGRISQELRTEVSPADAAASFAVEAVGLGKAFAERRVLHGVDLSVRRGEFVAILGRSGTGKSTLLRILGGLDPRFSGTADVAQRRAFVFQEPRLLPWKRVVDNVRLGQHGTSGKTRALAALQEVGLADLHRAWPRTLSGGEAQRVALARALVREPELLLLDEPFGALDALTRIRMHVLLQQLCRRHEPAVLLVTHDVDEAILLADRVVVLDDGRITLDGDVALTTPRLRADHAFGELRSQLLAALGVDEIAEGARA
jgi:sulfonate transport system ATP-binding protein